VIFEARLRGASSHRNSIVLSPANCRYALRAFCAPPAQKRSPCLIDKPDGAKTLSLGYVSTCMANEISRSRRRLGDDLFGSFCNVRLRDINNDGGVAIRGLLGPRVAFFVWVEGKGVSMTVRLPTLEQIDNLAADFGLVLTPEELEGFQQAFKGPLASYSKLDE